jgi:quercetin dioxygenase-like cupin family protein
MDIKRSGSQPSRKGLAEYFTGNVRIDPLFQANNPAHTMSTSITFEPGARTAWHTHPLGQTLIVIAGSGLVQCWGGPIEEIRPGDVIWCPPAEKHWHGATPTTAMTHIAIVEHLAGNYANWMEKVSDQQYQAVLRTVQHDDHTQTYDITGVIDDSDTQVSIGPSDLIVPLLGGGTISLSRFNKSMPIRLATEGGMILRPRYLTADSDIARLALAEKIRAQKLSVVLI